MKRLDLRHVATTISPHVGCDTRSHLRDVRMRPMSPPARLSDSRRCHTFGWRLANSKAAKWVVCFDCSGT